MKRRDFLRMVEQNYEKLVQRCKLPADGHDIVGTVIADVLEKKSYKSVKVDKGNPLGWLFAVVGHRRIDFLRRKQREGALFVAPDDCAMFPCSTKSVVELSAACRVEISRLPAIQRAIVEHIYLGNETYPSLAELLGISVELLRVEGRKAKASLQKALW